MAIVTVADPARALYYVAPNGHIFAPVAASDPRDFPYLTGLGAAEAPTITVSKSDKIAIAVGKLDGADGALAAKTLQNDLTMSGYFTVAPAGCPMSV